MRKLSILVFAIFTMTFANLASAMLSMELTRGVAGAIPIAVTPFQSSGMTPPQNVSAIIASDLQNSGRFKVSGRDVTEAPSPELFRRLSVDNAVVGKVISLGGDRYEVSFQLLDMYHGGGKANAILSKKYTVGGHQLRAAAHRISDLVYEQLTGVKGVFSTKLAYVVVQRGNGSQARYILEVADQDGNNPRPLLSSPEPVMSPSWSPNGKELAYVSFENRHAGIYVQSVTTGARRLISEFPGINGAPAWSPDGRRLAIVLSKSGSPNIYILDIGSRRLTQMTNDFYINTEPAWSPKGGSLLFTSNRSGGVQLFQVNLDSKAVSRITYDGDYNARGSYTRDGSHIAMIHRVSGKYSIGILDLDTGSLRVLSSKATDSASPSLAPNGSMVLYDTVYGGRTVLGMVSTDGSIQLTMPARQGDAQDPAWSPYLS